MEFAAKILLAWIAMSILGGLIYIYLRNRNPSIAKDDDEALDLPEPKSAGEHGSHRVDQDS